MKRIFFAGIIILIIVTVIAFTRPGSAMMGDMRQMMRWIGGQTVNLDLRSPRPPENDRTVSNGRRIYEQRCAACHGQNGDGKGERANELYTKPRDFTTGIYKFRSTPTGSLPTDEDIYATLNRGIRGTAMLPRFNLTSDQKWAVTYYIKTFSDRFEEEDPDSPLIISDSRKSGTDYIAQGQRLFEQAKCWECHGKGGRGGGPKAPDLKDDWSNPIRPRSFVSEPFKGGSTTKEISRSIATGLDGTPMSSYRDALSDQEILSLATYVKSLGNKQARWWDGMMGMASMTHDERIGMMTDHHGGMMGGGMMGRGMMMR